MRMSNSVQWLRRASVIASTAAILSLVSLLAPASADEVKAAHVHGSGVWFDQAAGSRKAVQVNVKAKTKTLMEAWVVYLRNGAGACSVATEGTWTVTGKPKKGTTSTGLLSGPAPSNCTSPKKLKYNAIYYTSTATKGKDTVVANWKASYNGTNYKEFYKFLITIKP